jgi:hypothetical protein
MNAVRRDLLLWLGVVALVGVAKIAYAPAAPALAVALFLWAPSLGLRGSEEVYEDYGWLLTRWRLDLALALGFAAAIFPVFYFGFHAFLALLEELPRAWAELLAPYGAPTGFHWRLPREFLSLLAGNAAVAVAEEFFYRGYLQERLERAWGRPWRIAGAQLGPGWLLATALFALGHLVDPAPWRLGTFFPGLLFGWMRARTGTIAGAAVFHFLSNVWLAILEASAFG